MDENFLDFDRDGLVDVVELVYGTDPIKPDSDGDGILDGAEVDQGLNPLDGLPAITGIIATADTPGTAVDIAAFNDIVVVADSDRGVSVFNVFNGMDPTIVAQVDTPGEARAVALSGNLIAVADGSAGLAIIDIGNPPAARIQSQIPATLLGGGEARVVAALGKLAVVGMSSGALAAVELATATVLDVVRVEGGAVEDLSFGFTFVHVLSQSAFSVYQMEAAGFRKRGQVPVQGGLPPQQERRRLFVETEFAYFGTFDGYAVLDIRDPAAPLVVANPPPATRVIYDLAANGSGLLVTTSSTATGYSLAVYDASNPAVVKDPLVFNLPGQTTGLAIYNGLAYVAAGDAGLHVVNYLSYDALGKPPAIESIAASFPLKPPVAEEGQFESFRVTVRDDVQVRNVEFFIDGRRAFVDGNFPFEIALTTPRLAEQSSFLLRAIATDTGGNRTESELIEVALTQDVTLPALRKFSPEGARISRPGQQFSVAATFSESIASASLTPASFFLLAAGEDKVLGTDDDDHVPGGELFYVDQSFTAIFAFNQGLAEGRYRAVLTAAVRDLAGNRLEADFAWWEFQIIPPRLPEVPSGQLVARFLASPELVKTNEAGHVEVWIAENDPGIALRIPENSPDNIFLDESGLGGEPAVVFTDPDNSLPHEYDAYLKGDLGIELSNATVFMLGLYDASSAGWGRYAYTIGLSNWPAASTAGTQLSAQLEASTGNFEHFDGNVTRVGVNISGFSGVWGVWRQIYYGQDAGPRPTYHLAYRNGVDLRVEASPRHYLVKPVIHLGGFQGQGYNFRGRMAEFIVYKGVLSNEDIARIEAYLMARIPERARIEEVPGARTYSVFLTGASNFIVPGLVPHGDPNASGTATIMIDPGKLVMSWMITVNSRYRVTQAHFYNISIRSTGDSVFCWGGRWSRDDYLSGQGFANAYLRSILNDHSGWYLMIHTEGGHFAVENGRLVPYDPALHETSVTGVREEGERVNNRIGRKLADHLLRIRGNRPESEFDPGNLLDSPFPDANGNVWVEPDGAGGWQLTPAAAAAGYNLETEYLFYLYDDQGPDWDYGGPEGAMGGFLIPTPR